ncbi:MAG: hypothetical protein R2849_03445 [Thermomicrobiales bacterium]
MLMIQGMTGKILGAKPVRVEDLVVMEHDISTSVGCREPDHQRIWKGQGWLPKALDITNK